MVKFVSTKFPKGGISILDKLLIEDEDLFFCLHGRKEVVVECDSKLKETLRNLPSEYIQPRLKDIKKYLTDNNIPFIEDFKGTSVV